MAVNVPILPMAFRDSVFHPGFSNTYRLSNRASLCETVENGLLDSNMP